MSYRENTVTAKTGVEHLIVQTAFLGDLLLGIPLFKEIRKLKPHDKLTVLCRKGLGDLLTRLELVDEAIEVDKQSKESWTNAIATLRQRRFDLLICPHESIRSRRLAFSLRARRKIGYNFFLGRFVFHDRVARPMHLPEALRQLALLTPLDESLIAKLADFSRKQTGDGGQAGNGLAAVPDWADMSVPRLLRVRAQGEMTPRAREIAGEIGFGSGKIAFLAPGSVWKTKMWTADGFTRVARDLIADGFRVVILGAPDEKEICEEIQFRAPGSISICGRTSLFESAEVLALGDLLICNDSGAMHLASSARVPTVSVFGPTVLEFGYRPWQRSAAVVQVPRRELDCRPCGTHGAAACPIGTHECMKRVTPESVLQATKELPQAPAGS